MATRTVMEAGSGEESAREVFYFIRSRNAPFRLMARRVRPLRKAQRRATESTEDTEVEAEEGVAHEVLRAGAHQLAPDAAALVGLQHVERVDLGVEALDGRARVAARGEADDARSGPFGDPGGGAGRLQREAPAP